MNNYPQHTWTSEDSEKISSAYKGYSDDLKCPVCDGKVTIEKNEGKEHLKKEFIDTHFFVVFTCQNCKRTDTRTYKKGR